MEWSSIGLFRGILGVETMGHVRNFPFYVLLGVGPCHRPVHNCLIGQSQYHNGQGLRTGFQASSYAGMCWKITPIMENQMEKNMYNDMGALASISRNYGAFGPQESIHRIVPLGMLGAYTLNRKVQHPRLAWNILITALQCTCCRVLQGLGSKPYRFRVQGLGSYG